MLLIILLMAAGILAGLFVITLDEGLSEKILRHCCKIQGAATALLLFVMGLWLGGNAEFWQNIKTTGLHGLMFAAATILGSVIALYFFSKPLKKKGDE